MRCHRSTRFCAALTRWASVRCAATGMIRLTPNSTPFSMAHSMRSNLKMERRGIKRGAGRGRNNVAELKLDPVAGDAYDTTAADAFPGRDVELLPNPSAKHLREMLGMRAD